MMQQLSDMMLRFGIPVADGAHIPGTGFFVMYIHRIFSR